jgi:murein DD-endopeptidase MepM/ murein hydrolase activator NlpD
MANKIGCSNNKTVLVDPNKYDGQSSSNNISVATEDLNISVQLETFKKGRTVLSASKDGLGTAESSNSLSVRFIEGEKVNGQYTLTTKYTDLTTVFDDAKSRDGGQNLGITGIDIDFNSSYAPMVNITFIDLRGSAVFQNEQDISGKRTDNKYATFFQLPYPIFTLTIKGYYGKPVQYCLHMTKFTSKFNSSTGNFEITASFIGYTYAMLSDMLIGYLKAIPFTDIGAELYKTLNDERARQGLPPMLTLGKLMIAISSINDNISKLAAQDPNTKIIEAANQKSALLDVIEFSITDLGRRLEENLGSSQSLDNVAQYQYIVSAHQEGSTFNNSLVGTAAPASAESTSVINLQRSVGTTTSTPTSNGLISNPSQPPSNYYGVQSILAQYNTDISKAIQEFNSLGNPLIDEKQFTDLTKLTYVSLTKTALDTSDNNHANDAALKSTLNNPQKSDSSPSFDELRGDLFDYLNTNYGFIANDKVLDVYNVTTLYAKIAEFRKKITDTIETATTDLAKELKIKIGASLGFEPTIRQLTEVFTTAAEVFLTTLYRVSVESESTTNTKRQKALSSIFLQPQNSDIISPADSKYFAWPDYRENNQKDGYIEKYLGAARLLKNPNDVTELNFITNLKKAFEDASKAEKDALNNLTDKQTNWIPSNPLDTRLFNNNGPYTRLQAITTDDISVMMLIRAMTFIGYTNFGLSGDELDAQAKIEAHSVMKNIPDSKLIDAYKRLDVTKILATVGKINGLPKNILTGPVSNTIGGVAGNYYTYTYIFDTNVSSLIDTYNVLPISGDFKGTWYNTLTNDGTISTGLYQSLGLYLVGSVPSDFQGLIPKSQSQKFLTNYSPIRHYDDGSGIPVKAFTKLDDGGTYVEIMSANEYSAQANDLVEAVDTTNTLLLDELSKNQFSVNIKAAGYNVYGGIYGVQEFVKLDWGSNNPSLNDGTPLPLMYLFYADNYFNGLGRNRDVSGPSTTSNYALSKFDLRDSNNQSKIFIPTPTTSDVTSLVYDNSGNNNATHKDYGKNRNLFKAFKDGDSTITYPFINQRTYDYPVIETDNGQDQSVFSLFGSLWYYAQDKSAYQKYAKALLFLNTLPFNDNSFEAAEIIHLFDTRAGFIHAPRLWCAFIGGMMWRYDVQTPILNDSGDIIGGGSGIADPIIWLSGQTAGQTGVNAGQFVYAPRVVSNSYVGNSFPQKDQFFRILNPGNSQDDGFYPAFGSGKADASSIHGLDLTDNSGLMFSLPQQIRNEFKRIFFEFVNDIDGYMTWSEISRNLEIWAGSSDAYKNYIDSSILSNIISPISTADYQIASANIVTGLINTDKYSIITPQLNLVNNPTLLFEDFKYTLFLELSGGYRTNIAVQNIIKGITDEVVIANTNYSVWGNGSTVAGGNTDIVNMYQGVSVLSDDLTRYVTTFLSEIQQNDISSNDEQKQADQEIFGTADENIIKLQLYRTCKNINDKWLGDVDNEGNIIFQCGARNSLDQKIATHYRGDGATPRLIDSFRFVDRAFKDIGDDFYVNPLPVNEYLINNPNSSFYDAVTSLFSANNFDFIALPSYINYNDPDELAAMFEPMANYEKALETSVCGPSFVCVYVGQSSKHLDFAGSEYTNDGFDIQCDGNGGMKTILPKDFTNSENTHENKVAVFAVNYSQQNQNIFKDIILDQNEFTETAESLQIQDDIASKGSENNRTIAGQNMYNVYAVRSYKAEVEMMGNAMIQPMMYFQLNNIPMFHGAYMITHVRHSIKPNFMSTHFTGVRVRGPETPLITSVDLYQSLLSTIDLSLSSGGAGSTTTDNVSNSQFNQNIIPDPTIFKNNNGFGDPVSNAVVTSAPGHRTMSGKIQTHKGVDLAVKYGSPVMAMFDGTVEKIQYNYNSDTGRGYGLYMVINHGVVGDEKILYKTVYGHLSDIDKSICDITDSATIAKIKNGYNPNVKVTKGKQIGLSGGAKGQKYLDAPANTLDLAGWSTGAHLHFELRIGTDTDQNNDVYNLTYVDPLAYIPLGQNPKYSTALAANNTNSSITKIVTPTATERSKLYDNVKTW